MKRIDSQNHIAQIDGLRCFAVIGVIIAHFISPEFKNNMLIKIPFGTGVNLFFVISGYLITYILLNKKCNIEDKTSTIQKEIKNFFAKRIIRIFPLYYAVIILVFIFSYNDIKDYFIYLITFTTNIYMTFHNTYIGSRTHLWSLAVEEQFYLIWPFIIILVKRKYLLHIIFTLIFLSLCSKYYFINYSHYQIGANAFLISCFDSLGMGALLAYLQKFHIHFYQRLLSKNILLLLIIFFIILFILFDHFSYSLKLFFENFCTSIIYFFIVGIASENKFNRLIKYTLENKIALYIGKISYGIYIIHNFMPEMFYGFFAKKLPPTDFQSIRIFYWILLTIMLSSISWFLIEKPLLKLKRFFN